MRCRTRFFWVALFLIKVVVMTGVGGAHASEAAKQIYVLGYRSSLLGFMPPPGTYVQSDKYFYSGEASASQEFEFGGRIVADVDASIALEIPTFTWITNRKILGGNLGFFGIVPVGWMNIDVGVELATPFGATLGRNLSSTLTSVADPFLLSYVGWHAGNFHWMVGAGGTVPIGDYEKGRIANWGFNVWALDVGGALTWFDQQRGLELSFAPGITFRTKNNATDYKSGDELHLEGAAMLHSRNGLSFGVVGYHFQQLTADSGTGAVLGPFKGRVSALGVQVGANFKLAGRQASLKFKAFREFNVRNRLDEGEVAFVTFAMPLRSAPQPAAMR